MSTPGFEVEHFAEIDSTNTYLMGRAREGAPAGLVAVADHQTAGRGRLGRTWEAPPGASLLCSVLLRERLDPDSLHLATAVVALAAARAAERTCGLRPGIKWPNDLVIDGAKVAGVLAEADPDALGGPAGTTAIVVGIGINLTWPGPPDVGGTCLLDATGSTVGRDEILATMLEELSGRLELLRNIDGRAQLTDELERSLVTIGQIVTVETPSGMIRGEAVGLSAAGHLLVDSSGNVIEIAAGDIVHLRRANGAPSEAG
jgi:BirA family biotin operon repressor/biotin-[acetyl-CoA-carboxylase] ligase